MIQRREFLSGGVAIFEVCWPVEVESREEDCYCEVEAWQGIDLKRDFTQIIRVKTERKKYHILSVDRTVTLCNM